MKPKAKGLFGVFKQAAADWSEDKASRLAAALAYYTIFSIAPLLLIAIAVAGMVFGEEAARGQIVGQIQELIGPQGAEAIQGMIANAGQNKGQGTVATLIGIALLLFGASGVFAALQDSLNTIWEVAPKPDQGIWATIRTRFLSFGMVLGIGFLLLVSLLLSAALTGAAKMVSGYIANNEALLQVLNLGVSFVVITLLFAALYKYLPDAKIRWKDVWIGAIVTSLLFGLGKYLIGLYLGHSSTSSTFGAAGSLVVLLIWVYYSAQIFFFGAEFTQAYANRYGTRVQPSDHAVAVTEEMRAQQGLVSKERKHEAAALQETNGDGRTDRPQTVADREQPEPAEAAAHGATGTTTAAVPTALVPPVQPQAAAPTYGASPPGPSVPAKRPLAQDVQDVKQTAGQVTQGLVSFLKKAAHYYGQAKQHIERERTAPGPNPRDRDRQS
jgi:membrane protein